jgi:hypothetical protein
VDVISVATLEHFLSIITGQWTNNFLKNRQLYAALVQKPSANEKGSMTFKNCPCI